MANSLSIINTANSYGITFGITIIISIFLIIITSIFLNTNRKRGIFSHSEATCLEISLILYLIDNLARFSIIWISINWISIIGQVCLITSFIILLIRLHKIINTFEKGERKHQIIGLILTYLSAGIILIISYYIPLIVKLVHNQTDDFLHTSSSLQAFLPLIHICGKIFLVIGLLLFFIPTYKKRMITLGYDLQAEKERRREYRKLEKSLRKQYPKDIKIFKQYRSFPTLSLIFNLIALITFIIPWFNEQIVLTNVAIFLGIGTIILILVQIYLPLNKREQLAVLMKKKYQKKTDTEDDPFFYYYKREYELYGKLSPEEDQQKTTSILKAGKIIFFINYVFYIISSIVAVIFSGMILCTIGGVCYFIYHITKALGDNQIALMLLKISKATFKIFKNSIKFFKMVITFKLVHGYETSNNFGDSFRKSQCELPTDEAELQIDCYLKVEYTLPIGVRWEKSSLTCSGTNVSFDGTIYADMNFYNYERLSFLVQQITQDIEATLKAQSEEFLHDYPTAQSVSIDVNITGEFN